MCILITGVDDAGRLFGVRLDGRVIMTSHRAFNVAWLAVSAKHAPAVTAAVKTVFAHTDPADVAAPRARVKCSGTAVGDSESYEFWREFLASLRARGGCVQQSGV
ncbi:transposase [Mycolicibacterium gilvum]|uniref:Transposase n=1 Tax=Mycolicibacterium gilvum TaxID=1804 RepID=A0A378SFI6_9MYCO|nr:transposase [Mycolicibacterium gilvum]